MITIRSRCEVSCTSRLMAVKPPTFASAPGTACTASRSAVTVSPAAAESGRVGEGHVDPDQPVDHLGRRRRRRYGGAPVYGATAATPGTPARRRRPRPGCRLAR